MAAADQRGWSGRQLESNLASTPQPDLVVRRASDGEAFVVPTGGLIHFPAPTTVATGVTGATGVLVLARPDRRRPRRPAGAPVGRQSRRPAGHVVGHLRRDRPRAHGLPRQGPGVGSRRPQRRRARRPRGPQPGHRRRSCCSSSARTAPSGTSRLGTSWNSYDLISAAGDLTGDGVPDLVARDRSGVLWVLRRHRARRLRAADPGPRQLRLLRRRVTGGGDLTRDGHPRPPRPRRSTGDTYVLPGRGDGTFDHRLGPFSRLTPAANPTVGGRRRQQRPRRRRARRRHRQGVGEPRHASTSAGRSTPG